VTRQFVRAEGLVPIHRHRRRNFPHHSAGVTGGQ
jgi:hypothetical protein